MKRGQVVWCDFGNPVGHEQGFQRPAVVVSDRRLPGLAIVLPVTRSSRGYPTHIELEGVLPVTSYIQCEQIRVVSRDRIGRTIASVEDDTMRRVEHALARLLGLPRTQRTT